MERKLRDHENTVATTITHDSLAAHCGYPRVNDPNSKGNTCEAAVLSRAKMALGDMGVDF